MTQEEYLNENPNATLKDWIDYNKEKENAYDEFIVSCKKKEWEYLRNLIGKCFLFYQKDSTISTFTVSKVSKVIYSEYSKENILYGERVWICPESVEYDELLDELTKNSIIKTYNTELYTEMSKYKQMMNPENCVELSEENYIKIKRSVVRTIDFSNTLIDKIIKETIR